MIRVSSTNIGRRVRRFSDTTSHKGEQAILGYQGRKGTKVQKGIKGKGYIRGERGERD